MSLTPDLNDLNNCPPQEALPADGAVYRCCKSDPLKPKRMKTAEEADRLHHKPACQRRSLSVFPSLSEARHQMAMFRWRTKRIAKATLSPKHGVTLRTPGFRPSHTSWWPSGDLSLADRAALFEVVEVCS